MASYLSNPDYQTYAVSPYQLPKQEILSAIQSRNNFWDVGATQLKSAYQNYLNLDLSLKSNQDKLDNMMQGVNDGLKKSVSTDLSLADNVNTAMKIFDPITKDDGIKYDNALTKHYKSQIQIAQSLKTQNGGKDYNDKNFSYMLKPLQEFIKQDDPNKGREVYSNRRFYTPYHDVMDEWNKIEKNFKPDVTELTQPEVDEKGKLTNSGRMITTKNKSIITSQFRAYMSSHLSDKAKEQLDINGVMAYTNHPDILAGDYTAYNQEKIDTYKVEIEKLKGKKKSASNDARYSEADAYDNDIKRYMEEVKKLTLTNTKLSIGDYSDLSKNEEAIAGRVYSSNWIDNISKSSQRLDIEKKYSKDDTALFFLKMNNDNENKNADRALDYQMNQENIESREKVAKIKEGEGKDLKTEPEYVTATQTDNENFGKKDVTKLRIEGEDVKKNAVDGLNKFFESQGITKKENSKAQNEAAIEEWKKNNKNNYRWKEYLEGLDLGDGKIAAAKAIDDYVNTRMDEYYNKQNPLLKPLTVEQIQNNSLMTKEQKTFAIKEAVERTRGVGLKPEEIQEKNRLYDQAITNVEGIEKFLETPKESKVLKNVQTVIFNKISVPGLKPDDVIITHRDKSGGIYFKVDGSADGVSNSDIMKNIKAMGGVEKNKFVKGSVYLPNSTVGEFIKPKIFSDNRLSAIQTQVDFRTQVAKNNDIFSTTGIRFNNVDFHFNVTVKSGVPFYELIHDDSGASFIDFATGQPFSTLDQASSYASMLSNLKPEDLQLKIRSKSIGNKPEYIVK